MYRISIIDIRLIRLIMYYYRFLIRHCAGSLFTRARRIYSYRHFYRKLSCLIRDLTAD